MGVKITQCAMHSIQMIVRHRQKQNDIHFSFSVCFTSKSSATFSYARTHFFSSSNSFIHIIKSLGLIIYASERIHINTNAHTLACIHFRHGSVPNGSSPRDRQHYHTAKTTTTTTEQQRLFVQFKTMPILETHS